MPAAQPERSTPIRRGVAVSAAACAALALLAGGCGGGAGHTTTGAASAQPATPAARGQALYTQDGCSGCHSLDGTRLAGPTWKGLAGASVHLSDGQTVVADNAYLSRHIVEPRAFTVVGYPGEVMAQAIAPLELRKHPADVSSLVAFIDSLR
jgi:cytochrome c oxidase subunit II